MGMAEPNKCQHTSLTKRGKDRNGKQRWTCRECGKTMTNDNYTRPLGNMRISLDKAIPVLGLLLEGMGIRASARISGGISDDTICRLVLQVGNDCNRLLASRVVGVSAPQIEMDEMWSFVGTKPRMAPPEKRVAHEVGSTWTWFAIDSKSKLILSHEVGLRDKNTCGRFLSRLNRAVAGYVDIRSDGMFIYPLLIPIYMGDRALHVPVAKTSYSERFNLTVRMHVRRFGRFTTGHSKSHAHHAAMIALFVAWYNFCRLNSGSATDGPAVTPAVSAGLSDHQWTLIELVEMASAAGPLPESPMIHPPGRAQTKAKAYVYKRSSDRLLSVAPVFNDGIPY